MPEAKLSIKLENAKHKESIPNLKLLLLEIVLAQFSNAKVSERTKEPRGKEVAKMFRMNAETFRARIAEMGRQEGLRTGREEGLQTGRQEGLQTGLQTGREEGLQKGLQTGRQEGLQKGLQAGRAEGHIEERRKNARSMFLEGLSTEAVQRITGLSDEEMRTLRNGSH